MNDDIAVVGKRARASWLVPARGSR